MHPVYTGNTFLVELCGIPYGFAKVQGLKMTAEFTPVREGGLNDRVHMLPAPAQQNGKIVFEEGWCGGDVKFKAGSYISECISIQVIDTNGHVAGEFVINDAVVESWELSDLNAMESVVVVRRLTLIHSGIREAFNGSYI